MASKFMRKYKIVIPFISAVILMSQLVGCAILSQSEVQQELENETEIELEIIELEQMPGNGQTSVNVNGSDYIVDTAHGAPGTGEEGTLEDASELLEEDVVIISDSTMLIFFESAFEQGKLMREITNNQDTLQTELEYLVTFETDTLRFKEGYQDEYVAWRANKLASTEKLPDTSNNREDVSKGNIAEKAPDSGNGQSTEKTPDKTPSGGNTNSNTGGNSGSTNNSGSTGSVGPNSPMSSEYDPSADPNLNSGLTLEDTLNHLKNEGITIGGSGD